jgi:hypothetical protein
MVSPSGGRRLASIPGLVALWITRITEISRPRPDLDDDVAKPPQSIDYPAL